MATIQNTAPRIISLNGGEHNGHAPGGVTLLPNSAPVATSGELDEVLRESKAFLTLVRTGQIADLENTFGVTKDLPKRAQATQPAPQLPKPEIAALAIDLPSTATEIAPPPPVVVAVPEIEAQPDLDPFEGFAQAVTPAELAALTVDQAIAHVATADLDSLKAFWPADTRKEVRAAITDRANALKAAPAQ